MAQTKQIGRSMFHVAARLLALFALVCAQRAHAVDALGIGMEGFAYPHPVEQLELRMESTPVRLAYMDIAPDPRRANGRTALLLHGRNFFGAYWADTIAVLRDAGFRVVVPDQIGFGKSSKPDVPHSFHLHAQNLHALLRALSVDKVDIVAHSIGGMMAIRFALMYPEQVDKLVLESPIGLEDYRALVPYATREALTREYLESTPQQIDKFFRGFFVHWQPRFQIFSDVQQGWLRSPEAWLAARTAAHTWLMAYEQPVIYELDRIAAPTLLICGEQDRTALGRNRVSPEIRARLGRYTELAPRAARALRDGHLVMLPDVGHIPHLETPERFHALVLDFLAR